MSVFSLSASQERVHDLVRFHGEDGRAEAVSMARLCWRARDWRSYFHWRGVVRQMDRGSRTRRRYILGLALAFLFAL